MKKKLRTIIALLRSRAYLDSQEAAERKLSPRDDSHHEYERGQNTLVERLIDRGAHQLREVVVS